MSYICNIIIKQKNKIMEILIISGVIIAIGICICISYNSAKEVDENDDSF